MSSQPVQKAVLQTALHYTCKLLAMNSALKKFANAVDCTSLLKTTRPSKVLSYNPMYLRAC